MDPNDNENKTDKGEKASVSKINLKDYELSKTLGTGKTL